MVPQNLSLQTQNLREKKPMITSSDKIKNGRNLKKKSKKKTGGILSKRKYTCTITIRRVKTARHTRRENMCV